MSQPSGNSTITVHFVDEDDNVRDTFTLGEGASVGERYDLSSRGPEVEVELLSKARDGSVFCAICPQTLEIHGERQLIVGCDRDQLDALVEASCDGI